MRFVADLLSNGVRYYSWDAAVQMVAGTPDGARDGSRAAFRLGAFGRCSRLWFSERAAYDKGVCPASRPHSGGVASDGGLLMLRRADAVGSRADRSCNPNKARER